MFAPALERHARRIRECRRGGAHRGRVTPMGAEDDVTSAVYAEQVRSLFRQIPIALSVNIVNAALVAIVLTPLATRPFLLPWFASVTLVAIGRGILWLRYRRAPVQPENTRRWSTAGDLRFAAQRPVLGDRRDDPVSGPPGARSALSHHRDGRHVRRRHGDQRVASAVTPRLPPADKPANGFALFRARLGHRQRARSDDRCVRGGAVAGRKALQPNLRRGAAAALRTERGQSSLERKPISVCKPKWPNIGRPRRLCTRRKSSKRWAT